MSFRLRNLRHDRRGISRYNKEVLKWSLLFVGFVFTIGGFAAMVWFNISATVLLWEELFAGLGVVFLIMGLYFSFPM